MLDIRLDALRLPLSRQLVTARGVIHQRVGITLVIRDVDGFWGRGEFAPLPGWSSIDLDEGVRQITSWSAEVSRSGVYTSGVDLHPEVHAATETAMMSLASARRDEPLWLALGGTIGEVSVNALAVGSTPAELAAETARHFAEGVAVVKVKLGADDDADRIAAVAAATPAEGRIRFDPNAVWSDHDAVTLMQRALGLLGHRLDYIEDPAGSIDAIIDLGRRTGVPVAVDEPIRRSADMLRLLELEGREKSGVVAVVMKPPLLGGLAAVADMADTLSARGVRTIVSSLYDGPVGLAAWCHLAAAVAPGETHGLGTAGIFVPGVAEHLVPRQGRIVL